MPENHGKMHKCQRVVSHNVLLLDICFHIRYNMQLRNSLWIYLMCSNIKVHDHDISNFVESYKDISNKHENLKSSKLAIIKTFV